MIEAASSACQTGRLIWLEGEGDKKKGDVKTRLDNLQSCTTQARVG